MKISYLNRGTTFTPPTNRTWHRWLLTALLLITGLSANAATAPAQLYVIGDAVGEGWKGTVTSTYAMTKEGNTFTWTGNVNKEGYFAFTAATANGWDNINAARYTFTSGGNAVYADTSRSFAANTDGGTSFQFKGETAEYKITVNFTDMTFIFEKVSSISYETPSSLYIIGNINSWGTNNGAAMEKNGNTFTYTGTFPDSGDGYSWFSFTSYLSSSASDWDGIASYRYGADADGTVVADGGSYNVSKNTNAFKVPAGTATLKVTFTTTAITLAVTASGTVTNTYTVVGDKEIANGYTWAEDGVWDVTTNDMTNTTGTTWQLEVTNCNLQAKTYEYKVTVNHGWTEAYPASNAELEITEPGIYTVTFTYDSDTHVVDAKAVKTGDAPVTNLYLIGAFNSWDTETKVELAKQSDNTYKLTKEFEGEFKFIDNNNTYYGTSESSVLTITEAAKDGIALNTAGGSPNFNLPSSEWTLTVAANLATFSVAGTWPVAETKVYLIYAPAADWAHQVEKTLEKQTDGTYKLEDEAIPAKSPFQFVIDETWYGYTDEAYKDINYSNHENVKYGTGYENNFIMEEAGTYTFTVDVDNKQFTVSGTFTEPTHTYTAVGGQDSGAGNTGLFTSEWDTTDTDFDLNDDDADGVYTLTISDKTLSAGTYYYKVAQDHAWTTSYPSAGNASFEVKFPGNYDVTFALNPSTGDLTATLKFRSGADLYLVGEPAGEWTKHEAANQMTIVDGKYVIENVTINQDASFKIRDFNSTFDNEGDDIWYSTDNADISATNHENLPLSNSTTAGNLVLKAATGTFTVTLDPVAYTLTIAGTFNDMVHTYYAKGGYQGANEGDADALFTTAWTQLDANKLEKDGDVYKVVYSKVTLTAGTIEYKVHDVTADKRYGDGDDNKTITVPADGRYTVTITFNESTSEVNATILSDNVKVYLEYGEGDTWENSGETIFTDNSDGTFTLTDKVLAANTEFKLKIDDVWYGSTTGSKEEVKYGNSENLSLETPGTNFYITDAGTYTFTLDASTMKLTVSPFANPYVGAGLMLKGTFDSWAGTDFTDNGDGTYTLSNVTLTVGDEVKVYDPANDKWYGSADKDSEDNYINTLNGFHRTNIPLTTDNSGNFYINVAGTWTFTVDWEGKTFTADRAIEKYYILGEAPLNGWEPNDIEMTETSTGIYEYTVESYTVASDGEARSYKVRADKDWGWFDVPYVGNYVHTYPKAGTYKVVFTLDVTDKTNPTLTVTTTPVVTVTIASTSTDEVGDAYATLYYSSVNLKLPAGVVAQTYKVESNSLVVSKTYTDVIPAGEAVVLKGTASEKVLEVVDGTYTKDAANQLVGTDESETITAATGYHYFILSLNAAQEAGSAGFYYPSGTNGAENFTNNAHKAYLPVADTGLAPTIVGFAFTGGTVTGIDTVNAERDALTDGNVYTLDGRRVSGTLSRGIYVKNGKKFVVK